MKSLVSAISHHLIVRRQASNTRETVQKKLVYLYLGQYAPEKSDLSLLAVNTLQKDCRDDSPYIRAIALRALTSLRVPSLLDYIMQPLKNGLVDVSPYVRKTAALSCARIYKMAPATIRDDQTIVNRLYEMIRDRDAQVVANAIQALNEILSQDGGIVVNQKMALHLLDVFKNFNEWNQIAVLALLVKYEPEDDEVFPIMNILDDRLRHSNSAVVLSVVKLFLRYTERAPEIHQQVYIRVKEPLLTLLAGASSELEVALLAHIKILIERVPEAFQDQYKRFFSRYNDPVYAKLAKTEILQLVASELQFKEIIAELAETAKDLSPEVSKKSILAIGRVGIRLEIAVDSVVNELIQLLDVPSSSVCDLAMVALRDVLRKYRDVAPVVIPELQKCMKTVSSSEGKSALVWILGEYGDEIQESPYILEDLIAGWEEENGPVRLQLLTTSVKLFFRRTSEMRANLMNALNKGCADVSNPDVHDRALFYLRLIAHGLNHARRVFLEGQFPISHFEDEAIPEVKDKIFEEFNTLSVIYDEPSEQFIKKLRDIADQPRPAVALQPTPTKTPAVPPQPASPQGSLVDFSSSGETEVRGSPAPSFQTVPAIPLAATPSVVLKPRPQLSPKAFESTWKQLPAGSVLPLLSLLLWLTRVSFLPLKRVNSDVNHDSHSKSEGPRGKFQVAEYERRGHGNCQKCHEVVPLRARESFG